MLMRFILLLGSGASVITNVWIPPKFISCRISRAWLELQAGTDTNTGLSIDGYRREKMKNLIFLGQYHAVGSVSNYIECFTTANAAAFGWAAIHAAASFFVVKMRFTSVPSSAVTVQNCLYIASA